MSRQPNDFPKSYFNGGANVGAGKNPSLINLLNAVNRGFFDGVISVDDAKPTIDFLFKAQCPFGSGDLPGRYLINLTIHDLNDENVYPVSERATFDKTAIIGEIIQQKGPKIVALTNESGQFGGSILLKKSRSVNATLCVVASSCVDQGRVFIATTKTRLLQQVVSHPFVFSKP